MTGRVAELVDITVNSADSSVMARAELDSAEEMKKDRYIQLSLIGFYQVQLGLYFVSYIDQSNQRQNALPPNFQY